MKKILSVILLSAFFFYSSAQKNTLELNLVIGKTYHQKMVSEITTSQNVSGREVNVNMKIISITGCKVVNFDNNLYTIETRYESMSMRMDMGGQITEYSSEKNDTTTLSSVLAALISKPFTIVMTKTGKVRAVKNFESLLEGIYDKFPNFSEGEKQKFKHLISESYGEKSIRANFEMVSNIFPDKPVSIGDKWFQKTKLESMFKADVETNYELIEIEDSFYILSVASKIISDLHDSIVTSGMAMKYNLTGSSKGYMKIYRNSGWVKQSGTKMDLTGSMEIMPGPGMPEGMKLPMNMKNASTITGW